MYNKPKAVFTTKTLDKMEENKKLFMKSTLRANNIPDYSITLTKDRYETRKLLFEFVLVCIMKNEFMQPEANKARTNQSITNKDFNNVKKAI